MKSRDYEALLARLLEILRRLHEGQLLSVVELAREFGVSDRTIQRDFNERLKPFGLEKSGRRWKMKRGYSADRLSEWEDRLVLELLGALAENTGPVFGARAKRLLSRVNDYAQKPFFTPLVLEDAGQYRQLIDTIEPLIQNGRAVRFFLKADGRTQSAATWPLRILTLEGRWFLAGLEAATKAIKFYPLAQIASPVPMVDTFKPGKKLLLALENALNTRFDPVAKPFTAHLLADESIADRLRGAPLSPTQKIVREHKDGSIEITLSITHALEILPLIGYFLGALQILSPDTLKDELKEKLSKL